MYLFDLELSFINHMLFLPNKEKESVISMVKEIERTLPSRYIVNGNIGDITIKKLKVQYYENHIETKVEVELKTNELISGSEPLYLTRAILEENPFYKEKKISDIFGKYKGGIVFDNVKDKEVA